MKKRLIFSFLVSVFFSGCMLQGISSKQGAEPRASSVVAITLPEFQLLAGDSVSWYGDVVWADPQQLLLRSSAVRGQLKDEIQAKMAERHNGFVKKGEANYEVFAAVILGTISTEEKSRLNAFFKIDPTLDSDSDRYEEGTLLMAIGKRDNPQALWRGAVKMFVLGNDIMGAQAQQRLKKVVDLMVSSIPNK